jgi:hypothetical protein
MALRTKSVVAALVCACMMLTGYAISGNCQTAKDKSRESNQPVPDNQGSPVSLRNIRLGLEIIADLDVSPSAYRGPCPGEFTFKGRITVNKPITLFYRFAGGNVPPSAAKKITFEGPGTKEVIDVRRFGDKQPSFSGSAVLQVVWPGKADSNGVYFKGLCTNYSHTDKQETSLGHIEKPVQSGPQMPGPDSGLKGTRPGTTLMPGLEPGGQQAGPGVVPGPGAGPVVQGQAPGGVPLPELDLGGQQPGPGGAASLQGPAPGDMPGPGAAIKEPLPVSPSGP